jgi:transcriptional antiterminator RfaH
MRHWYLIHTKVCGETSAQINLARQGYEVYLPRLVQSVRLGEHWHERTTVLFPRYMFMRLDEGKQSLRPVHSTVGVSNVVRFGACYTIVPDEVVDDLRGRGDPQTGLHRLSRCPALAPGAAVCITAGAFDGLQGVFERDAGAERVLVLLELLGQEASVRVPAACVSSHLPVH